MPTDPTPQAEQQRCTSCDDTQPHCVHGSLIGDECPACAEPSPAPQALEPAPAKCQGCGTWHDSEDAVKFCLCRGSVPAPQAPPAEQCKKCGRVSPVWFTSNEHWNRINQPGILCPMCFIEAAEASGLKPTGWLLMPEDEPIPAALTAAREERTYAELDAQRIGFEQGKDAMREERDRAQEALRVYRTELEKSIPLLGDCISWLPNGHPLTRSIEVFLAPASTKERRAAREVADAILAKPISDHQPEGETK